MKTDLTDRIWKECRKLCWKWILGFPLKDIKDVMNVRNPLKYHINKVNTGSTIPYLQRQLNRDHLKRKADFKDLLTFRSHFSHVRNKFLWNLFCKSCRYKSLETYFQLSLFWSQYPPLQLGKGRLATRFEIPSNTSFDKVILVWNSCHLVERFVQDFFCDCFEG